jgi:hypothetical protein
VLIEKKMDSVKRNLFDTSPKIPHPGYLKVDVNGCINESDDVLKVLLLEELFTYMCESDDDINSLIDEPEWYVYSRSQLMVIFGYNTIPTLLKNIGNINHNIRLYNKYVRLEEQADSKICVIPEFSIIEINAIVKFGIHMIQSYVADKLGNVYVTEDNSESESDCSCSNN